MYKSQVIVCACGIYKAISRYLFLCRIKEACILLTLKTGSACLLKELLCEEKEAVKKQNALHEQQIYKLNPTKALDVLNTRFNLPKTH